MGLTGAFAASLCRLWTTMHPGTGRSVSQRKRVHLRKNGVQATVSKPADASSATQSEDAVQEQPLPASDSTVSAGPMRSVPVPNHILDCVVKIFATHCEPNYGLPWAMTCQKQSVSTGFIISGRRILTNAHAVEHHTVVMIKRRGSDVKYRCKVVAVGNDCDIALLHVQDPRFWKEHDQCTLPQASKSGNGVVPKGVKGPNRAKGFAKHSKSYPPFNFDTNSRSCIDYPYLTAGGAASLNDSCIVVGYPFPGESISVTTGVISRIEMQKYVHTNGELLAVQIDAAINSGNSGGPVLDSRFQVLGIAFQSLDAGEAESVGYFIPNVVVEHFLDDIAMNSEYSGFPYPGFEWQCTENEALRAALGIPEGTGGVLVRHVDETSEAARELRKGDVVTHIEGIPVSSSGTIPFQSGERICFEYKITTKFVGEELAVSLLRGAETLDVKYQLPSMGEARLVPVHDPRRQPDYLIIGGLVFQQLSEPFLRAVYGERFLFDAPVRLIDQYNHAKKTADGITEIVILAQILCADVNEGYESDVSILHKFNQEKVRSLTHLAKLIDSCPPQCRYFHFEHGFDEVIILDRRAAEKEAMSILDTHCIPQSRSAELSKKSRVR